MWSAGSVPVQVTGKHPVDVTGTGISWLSPWLALPATAVCILKLTDLSDLSEFLCETWLGCRILVTILSYSSQSSSPNRAISIVGILLLAWQGYWRVCCATLQLTLKNPFRKHKSRPSSCPYLHEKEHEEKINHTQLCCSSSASGKDFNSTPSFLLCL